MKNMKKLRVIIFMVLSFVFGGGASAHSRYILPSHTVLSGEEVQSTSLVASISNDIFHPDMPFGDNGKGVVPMPMQAMFKHLKTIVIDPKGEINMMDWQAFARFSVADLKMKESGTYRVSTVQPPISMTTFKQENGNPGRVFGENPLPEGATEVINRSVSSRVETYISKNKPNRMALTIQGTGLELESEGHPNDLFANEEGRFRLLFNGESVGGVKISLTRSGTNHRNQRNETEVVSDEKGYFNLSLSEAGFYLLEAEHTVKGAPQADIDFHHYSLFVTLEFFAE